MNEANFAAPFQLLGSEVFGGGVGRHARPGEMKVHADDLAHVPEGPRPARATQAILHIIEMACGGLGASAMSELLAHETIKPLDRNREAGLR